MGVGPLANHKCCPSDEASPCMTREAFTRLVEEALTEIPRRFRDAMTNVAVVVEDEPSPEVLEELEIEPGESLFGLYQGTPLPERSGRTATRCPTGSRSTSARSRKPPRTTRTSSSASPRR